MNTALRNYTEEVDKYVKKLIRYIWILVSIIVFESVIGCVLVGALYYVCKELPVCQ